MGLCRGNDRRALPMIQDVMDGFRFEIADADAHKESRQAADHLVEKSVTLHFQRNLCSMLAYIERMDGTHRAVELPLRIGRERCKVMLPLQPCGGGPHFFNTQRAGFVQAVKPFGGRHDPAVVDKVAVFLANRAEARVKIGRRSFKRQYTDIAVQLGIQSPPEIIWIDRILQIEMRHLSTGVYTGISAAGRLHPHRLLRACHMGQQPFQLTLDCSMPGLHLPARVVRTVIRNLDFIPCRHRGIISNAKTQTASIYQKFDFYHRLCYNTLMLFSKSKTAWGLAGITLAGVIGATVYDCPLPASKFTYHDLTVPEEVADSYETLMRYSATSTNRLKVTLPTPVLQLAGTWSNVLPHSELINRAWDNFADGRKYIQDLNRHPFITDWDNSAKPIDPSSFSVPDYQTLRYTTLLYGLHATLLIQQGLTEEGIEDLTRHYSVIRKSLPYSTTLVTFAINVACAKLDIQIADHVVRRVNCTPRELKMLQGAFPPISREEYSWYRPLIAEYFNSQSMVLALRNNDITIEAAFDPPLQKHATFPRQLFFKPNMTLRLFKNIYEPLIDACRQRKNLRPLLKDVDDTLKNSSKLSRIWNPSGHMLVSLMVPVWQNVYDKTLELKTASDLLALEINSRLGISLKLKDVYNESNYRFDEIRQCFYCVGPDGIDGTADDIYINDPDVR